MGAAETVARIRFQEVVTESPKITKFILLYSESEKKKRKEVRRFRFAEQ
jgi:hypothetical protein